MNSSLILSIITFIYGLAGFLYIFAWIFKRPIAGKLASWVAIVGLIGNTAGIILQNTTVENAARVAGRLEEEITLQLSALNGGTQFDLAVAVYPTEANTFSALKSLAKTRLGGSER